MFKWAEVIAQWLEQHAQGKAVSLLTLEQALGMPVVEVWLGLLLGGFDMKQRGEFYAVPEGIWLFPR